MAKKKETYSVKDEFKPYVQVMPEGNLKIYITERILDQISWYDKKSTKNQKGYKKTMVISIIMSALIPVVTLVSDFAKAPWTKIFIIILSSTVTGVAAISALYNFRDLWIQYRTNCELLKSMLHQYFTNSCDFNIQDEQQKFLLLVERCEGLMTKEFQTWATNTCATEQEKKTYSTSS